MHRNVLWLAMVTVLVVAVGTAMMAPGQAKDEAADWRAVTEAVAAVNQDRSDENLKTLGEAIEAYLKNNPEGSNRERAIIIGLQVKRIQEDWQGLAEFVDSHMEGAEGQTLALFLYHAGLAQAHLGNTEQAQALAERLQGMADPSNPRVSQAIRRYVTEIRRTIVLRPGLAPPAFKLPKVDGSGEVSLSDLEGKYVLLDFWATWCRPCSVLMDRDLKPLWEMYGENEKFELVGIGINSRDSAERQLERARQNGYHWTKLFDQSGSTAREYMVTGIPFLVFIGPDGKVISAGSSAMMPQIREVLEKALGDDAEGADAESEAEDGEAAEG